MHLAKQGARVQYLFPFQNIASELNVAGDFYWVQMAAKFSGLGDWRSWGSVTGERYGRMTVGMRLKHEITTRGVES